ncbi:MAG TPA: hypothetical protein [Caudoviricetes sp.]|jgi:hypothetical protein|nr:MAG TPA: hypothetical protein [Caudoviricetes sp.]
MWNVLFFIWGLLMAGCGVALIIALIALLVLLIKSFKEEW